MFSADNYISFHDLTLGANFLWVSPSVQDVLGYTPEDLIGCPTYDYIHPEDIPLTKVTHKENLKNDLVASQIVIRYIAKDGRFIPCIAVFGLCYDFIFNCATLLDPNVYAYKQLRAHSTAMTRMVGSKKKEFERIRRHHEAFASNAWKWNLQGMEPEPRVCVIMNRYTRNLVVMYASSACELVFRVDPDHIVGRPFLLYIRADDLAPFVEQTDFVRSNTSITHMRFWFQSPNWPQEIPCEAMLCAAADGMVAVVRRCKPFVRKHLIGGMEHYESKNQGAFWASNDRSSSTATTPTSITPTNMSLSPSLESAHFPEQLLNRSRLNRIKVVELNDSHVRPLTDISTDDPSLMQGVSQLPEGYQIKENYIQEYEEDSSDNDDDSDGDGHDDGSSTQGGDMDQDIDAQSHKTNDTISHGVQYGNFL
ncbi:hypothetical protein B0O80DRAFT_274097 [Mortierella sp. GBAus27b]|nr:hypothetical protein BGX31_005739 [Mortierella sp. GBA43]KAI8358095.1 hypothetical protein B0O80DRAFT_274097 [Mortierella sp. GBAus27b]